MEQATTEGSVGKNREDSFVLGYLEVNDGGYWIERKAFPDVVTL